MQFRSACFAYFLRAPRDYELLTAEIAENDRGALVPQVRALVLGANLGDTLPHFPRGVSSFHAPWSPVLSGIRTVPPGSLGFARDFGSELIRPLDASTFSCYRRQPYFEAINVFELFVQCLEDMRRRFELCVYGYVVMLEHVHLLLSEPLQAKLAEAIHYLKLSFAKRLRSGRSGDNGGTFWQKRYYERNVRNYREFVVKLRYLHRNPMKRGLVVSPEEWKWSSYRHYALRETGIVEIESEWTARDREQKACAAAKKIFLRPG